MAEIETEGVSIDFIAQSGDVDLNSGHRKMVGHGDGSHFASQGGDVLAKYEYQHACRAARQSTGELRLMEAMLMDAIYLAKMGRQTPKRAHVTPDEVKEAQRWIMGSLNREELYSIENVCDHLGVDVERLRRIFIQNTLANSKRKMRVNINRNYNTVTA